MPTLMNVVLVRDGDGWSVAAFHNTRVAPAAGREPLGHARSAADDRLNPKWSVNGPNRNSPPVLRLEHPDGPRGTTGRCLSFGAVTSAR